VREGKSQNENNEDDVGETSVGRGREESEDDRGGRVGRRDGGRYRNRREGKESHRERKDA